MAEEDRNTLLMLGEIRGQLNHVIENTGAIRTDLAALTVRVSALEADKSQRDGRDGVLTAFLRSPFIAWIVSAAVTVWALLSGRAPG